MLLDWDAEMMTEWVSSTGVSIANF